MFTWGNTDAIIEQTFCYGCLGLRRNGRRLRAQFIAIKTFRDVIAAQGNTSLVDQNYVRRPLQRTSGRAGVCDLEANDHVLSASSVRPFQVQIGGTTERCTNREGWSRGVSRMGGKGDGHFGRSSGFEGDDRCHSDIRRRVGQWCFDQRR